MNRIYQILDRLALWLDPERLSIGIGAFYGAFIWLFHSFRGSSAFSVYSSGLARALSGVPPETIFALPLLAGAGLQGWGLHRHSRRHVLWGTMAGFFVFFSAFISCSITAPASTGVPAYFGLSAFYLIVALRCATGRAHSFAP